MKHLIAIFSFIVVFIGGISAQTKIAPKAAAKHIGEEVMVTGKIFSGKLIASNNMTLLDMGGFNPNQELTIMIIGTERGKFKGKPEEDYKGKEVTVTGKLIDYKGKPEIVVSDPTQLKVVLSDNIIMPVATPGH
jgi:DNA/RNA endonuclease YhcR with UshA esterase domain